MKNNLIWLTGAALLLLALCAICWNDGGVFGLSDSDHGELGKYEKPPARPARTNRSGKKLKQLSAKAAYDRLVSIAEAGLKEYSADQEETFDDRATIDHILLDNSTEMLRRYWENQSAIERLIPILTLKQKRTLFEKYYLLNDKGIAKKNTAYVVIHLSNMLLEDMAQNDAPELLAWLRKQGYSPNDQRIREHIALGWAAKEPRRALAYWKSNTSSAFTDEEINLIFDSMLLDKSVTHQIFKRIARANYRTALTLVSEQVAVNRASLISTIIEELPSNCDFRGVIESCGQMKKTHFKLVRLNTYVESGVDDRQPDTPRKFVRAY